MKTWQKIKQRPDLLEKYLVREKVIDTIRKYFKELGFREVFTPILVPVPSAESNLEVFETLLRTANKKERKGYLIMSPEYSLKKLLAANLGDIFEITRAFRNEEEVSETHNHEFTILEWYKTGGDYKDLMEETEKLIIEIFKAVKPDSDFKKWIYQGEEYDLSIPWARISVAEAFERYAGIETEVLLDRDRLTSKAKQKGYTITTETTWEQTFYQLFFNEIEPALKAERKPVFVYDYPAAQAALARKKKEDPRFAERCEVFLAGLEIGNGFSELTDPYEQSERFISDLAERKLAGKTEYPMDSDFIEALKSGIPETAGIAVAGSLISF